MLLCLQSLLRDGIQDGKEHLHVNVRQTNVHNIECNLKHKGELEQCKYKFLIIHICFKTYEKYVQYCYTLKVSIKSQNGKSDQKVCWLNNAVQCTRVWHIPEPCITHKIPENWHPAHKLYCFYITSNTRFFWWTCEASSRPPELDSLCLGSGLAFRSTWMVSGSMMDWAVSSSAVREQENTSKDWRVHDRILSWALGRKFSMAVLCTWKTKEILILV